MFSSFIISIGTSLGTKLYKNKIQGLRGKATGLCFNLQPKNIITLEEAENVVTFMKDKTMGSYDKLVEVGRKYQGDSKIMFDKMQDFSYVSQSLLEQVADSNRSVDAIRTAAGETEQSLNSIMDKMDEIDDSIKEIMHTS